MFLLTFTTLLLHITLTMNNTRILLLPSFLSVSLSIDYMSIYLQLHFVNVSNKRILMNEWIYRIRMNRNHVQYVNCLPLSVVLIVTRHFDAWHIMSRNESYSKLWKVNKDAVCFVTWTSNSRAKLRSSTNKQKLVLLQKYMRNQWLRKEPYVTSDYVNGVGCIKNVNATTTTPPLSTLNLTTVTHYTTTYLILSYTGFNKSKTVLLGTVPPIQKVRVPVRLCPQTSVIGSRSSLAICMMCTSLCSPKFSSEYAPLYWSKRTYRPIWRRIICAWPVAVRFCTPISWPNSLVQRAKHILYDAK